MSPLPDRELGGRQNSANPLFKPSLTLLRNTEYVSEQFRRQNNSSQLRETETTFDRLGDKRVKARQPDGFWGFPSSTAEIKRPSKGDFAQGKDENGQLQLSDVCPKQSWLPNPTKVATHLTKNGWPRLHYRGAFLPNSKMALIGLSTSCKLSQYPLWLNHQVTRASAGSEGKSASARGACAEGSRR